MADFDGRLRIRVLQLAQLDSRIWTSMVSGGNDCLEFLNRVSQVRFLPGPPMIKPAKDHVCGLLHFSEEAKSCVCWAKLANAGFALFGFRAVLFKQHGWSTELWEYVTR